MISICGIGASAGGVEALQEFFAGLSSDLGLAYVVILHLAPDRKSQLPAILSRRTSMPVVQVGDHEQAKLQPDHVYVIAPDRKLEITDSAVGASAFEQPRGQRAAIDLFFRSLAKTHGDGFAVILSGTGADGALGARAVKANGGLVLVQDPDDAAQGEMPRTVIATGVADIVLPVRELPARLAQLARHKKSLPAIVRGPEEASSITQGEGQALAGVIELLKQRTGHDFSRYRRSTILRRFSRRLQLTGHLTIADYCEHLKSDPHEAQVLFEDLLISATSFFRDPESWIAIQTEVVAPLVERVQVGDQIRVWMPGCATGEEAYSLAILFHEEFRRRGTRPRLMIFASDVDESAIVAAREGLYPRAISADVSERRLEQYFRPDGDRYRVIRPIRDSVVFVVHDLLHDPPFSRVHLISCRNVLIHLEPELQRQVATVFRYASLDDALLVLGSSETVPDDLFEAVDRTHRIFSARARPATFRTALPELLAIPGGRTAHETRPSNAELRSAAAIHLAALESAAPPSVVIDARWNVLHISPNAARYFRLTGGPVAQRITDLVTPELRDELRPLLRHAVEDPSPHLSPFVPLTLQGAPHRIAMIAQQRQPAEGRLDMLVTFLDAGASAPASVDVEQRDVGSAVRTLRDQLREAQSQIEDMHDDHEVTTEDLRAANEELQSVNEEYRSTTEELETSKEELQSMNEELQSVNHELQAQLAEMTRAHNDIENLMAATDVATLFLDRNLCIKRFTPQLEQLINIKTRDLNRPIADLTHALEYDTLHDDALQVLTKHTRLERTVASRAGRTYVVRLNPYRTDEGRDTDGVVITFVDVTAIKETEDALRDVNEQLHARTQDLEATESRLSHQAAELLSQDRNREEFLAALGHELRNPLSAIVNSLALLNPSDERARHAGMVLRRQTAHMTRLINDLLDIARVKHGKLRLKRTPTELNQWIVAALESIRPQADAKGLTLKYQAPSENVTVYADPERLTQVLDNLLRNAVTHTDHGEIEVLVARQPTCARIAVRDTGVGIDPDDAQTLFTPYQQRASGERGNGLGLGLTLVKALVEAHQGTVAVRSEGRGKGSEFSFTLPLASEPVSTMGEPTAVAPATARVLVVDDQHDIADMFGALLETLGQDVTVVYSGADALRAVGERQPQVAFIDLSMPEMTGVEVAHRLREQFPTSAMTLVAVTGHGKPGAAAASAFDGYLVKPVSKESVTAVLCNLSHGDARNGGNT